MARIKYPIGIQSFSNIRNDGYLYVDKTAYIHHLIEAGTKFVFLSRPRRFGKSLFISTLESFFKGDRELFCGLDIYNLLPGPWETYPVIRLDLSGANYNSKGVLDSRLNFFISELEERFELSIPDGNISDRFIKTVRDIFKKTGKRVVILIDEYDNPITSAIDNKNLQMYFRETLYGFYSSLKTLDDQIKFCMITGITKYGHLSVFSGLNNLKDISMLDEYAGICGVTTDELHSHLSAGVEALAAEEGYSPSEAYAELKHYYDGYHFSRSMLDIFNPYSLLNALDNRHISDYWFQSGIPTILMKSLGAEAIDFSKISGMPATENMLNDISADRVSPSALFYQTGYLTIKDYNKKNRIFTLDYPNVEITNGLMKSVLTVYGNVDNPQILILKLKDFLEQGDIEGFIRQLTVFFAQVPYDLRKNIEKFENYYHSLFYVIVKLLGMDTKAEYHTSEGSIDILIETDKYVYVIELKMKGDAEAAMNQIEERGYGTQFEGDPRQLIKVGLGFSHKSHTIDTLLVKRNK